jgi:hypothetical protein
MTAAGSAGASPYPRKVRRAWILLAAALFLAGCGGSKSANPRPTSTTSTTITAPPPATTATQPEQQFAELYLLDAGDHKLYAVRKQIEATQAVGAAALKALAEGPDTEVPPNLSLTIAGGDAHVTGAQLSPAATAQVVYTLTQFASVKSVDGKTRRDVEAYVPAILVEQPTPHQRVTSPLFVGGNANTFEATFEYDLKDATGRVLDHDFVTATSGSGERGTFGFAVPFRVASPGDGTLVVYERSAADGSIVHERQIPLTLLPGGSP